MDTFTKVAAYRKAKNVADAVNFAESGGNFTFKMRPERSCPAGTGVVLDLFQAGEQDNDNAHLESLPCELVEEAKQSAEAYGASSPAQSARTGRPHARTSNPASSPTHKRIGAILTVLR
jgi:hypothetical protein